MNGLVFLVLQAILIKELILNKFNKYMNKSRIKGQRREEKRVEIKE